MATVGLQLKAEAASAALKSIIGERPAIQYTGGYARLAWDPDQVARLQGKLDSRLTKSITSAMKPAAPPKAGDLVVAWAPIVNPVLARKALPAVLGVSLGLMVVGVVVGRLTHGKRR